jgi:hypothetical protein
MDPAHQARTDIVRDTIRRFPLLPTRTIAWYILHNHGPLFDGNLENIRSQIRYCLGTAGDKNRASLRDKIQRTHPPVMPKTWRKIRTPHKLSPGLWLVLPDIHIPFHEPKPIESAIKFGQQQKIDGILLPGDLQDCAAVTFWPTMIKRDFDKEVESVIDFLDLLAAEFPKANIVWKPGNHEYRLPRYYASKAPELIGLASQAMVSVLALEERGIEFLDYHQIVMAGKLPIIHGHEMRISTPVNPARGLFLKAKTWAMCAHFHRTSEHTSTNLQGTLLTTWSMGCLCDLSPDYNPFGNDWCFGCALVNVEKNGNFTVNNRRILANGDVV